MIYKTKNNGFSIVELLVALVLGLIVSGAAIQLFAGNKNTYRFETALSRLQENGRFAIDKITKDIRMAGYSGCLSRGAGLTPSVSLTPETPPFAIDGSDSIRGFNSATTTTWLPSIDAALNLNAAIANRQVLAGTDVVNIQRASSCGAQVTSALTGKNDTSIDIFATNDCDFDVNQVVLITDCKEADLFQISSITNTNGTLNRANGDLSQTYPASATEVFRWESNAYYISTGSNGELSLLRSIWDASQATNFSTVEIAEGVENLQILYGVDTGVDEYVDSYVTADAVTNWERVRSVRISLLMRSPDFVTQEIREIDFNGVTVNPEANVNSDRRLRTVYTSTVSLRNDTP